MTRVWVVVAAASALSACANAIDPPSYLGMATASIEDQASATAKAPAKPAPAAVRHVSLSGNRIAVHYDTPAESAIVVLDLTTGAVVSKVVVAPGK